MNNLQEVRAGSVFLGACAGKAVPHTPLWFMRQAGRALPEYRALRGEGSILDAIRQPELATEITLQPVRRLGVDAAILFSDIMTPLVPLSFGVDIAPGIGPVVENPFSTSADLERFREFNASNDVPYVLETVHSLVQQLEVPLIGFAGAPFTLASYLIEGRPSKHHEKTKVMAYSQPELFDHLLDALTKLTISYLKAQVDAGASALQVFDSWAGALPVEIYRLQVLPHINRILDAASEWGVPTILFGTGTSELLQDFAATKATVVGVDSQISLSDARKRVGISRPVQGNLDPIALLAPWETVRNHAQSVLNANNNLPGHIFNLGHGVLPQTDPKILEQLVHFVHTETKR